MSVHPLTSAHAIDAIAQAKTQLAAAHRLAVLHELEEGIDNHFTVTVPGHDDRYLILPFGMHWSEARASAMIVFDESGTTLDGEGVVELSAQCIHAPIHRICGVRVVLHTHQPWALALNMLKDNRLLPANQTAAFFHGHIAYDDDYSGTADSLEEGERLAGVIGDKQILFMKKPRRDRHRRQHWAGLQATLQTRACLSHAGVGAIHGPADRSIVGRRRETPPSAIRERPAFPRRT